MLFVNAHNVLPIYEMFLIKSYGISPSYTILNNVRLQQEMSIKPIFCYINLPVTFIPTFL